MRPSVRLLKACARARLTDSTTAGTYAAPSQPSSTRQLFQQRLPALADGRGLVAARGLQRRGADRPAAVRVGDERSIAGASSPGTSSGGTSSPSLPGVMISDGPRGQSKETTGRPTLIASTITIPKPSKREESTNRLAPAIASPSCFVGPIRNASSCSPSSRIRPRSASRSRPPP